MKSLSKIFCIVTLFLSMSQIVWAYDVEIDGIYYNLNKDTKTSTVTYGNSETNSYTGEIKIPDKISFNGVTYSVTSIGKKAFYKCTNLAAIIIPNSITGIGMDAFNGCNSLAAMTISNNLDIIGIQAFSDCSSLRSLFIPKSVTSIREGAFAGCSSLTSIEVENGNNKFDSRNNCNAIIETSSNMLIVGCMNTVIPNNVVKIDTRAFQRCSKLISITIPHSVTIINAYAFSGCNSLTSISIPNSVTMIGECAFQGCSSLESIEIENGNKKYDSRNNCNAIIEASSNKLIAGCKNTIIPNSVTSIGSFAFYMCSGLISIIIPNSVITIGDAAFRGCSGLNSVTLSNNLTTIYNSAFKDCSGLTSITIPKSVTSISYSAFEGCRQLASVISLIDNPFPISTDVFKNISSISVLHVPKGTTYIYNTITGWSNYFSSIEEISTAAVYTLSIKTIGNGLVSYGATNIKNETNSFQLEEGNSTTITISPDNGYRIKSVKVNSVDVTSSVLNNSYTVSNIKANTTVEVEFEAIPIPTYTLYVKSTGNGSVTYNGTTAKNNTQTFTLNEGTSAIITLAPDNGYRIMSVKVNSADVTSNVSNNSYTVSNIKANTTVEVEFEAIPIPTYTLSVKATGNGSATYNGTTAKNNTQTFTLNEGTSATISFSPDNGYRIKSVKMNSMDVTTSVSNNQYTINNIKANTTVEVEFEAIPIPTYTLSVKATGNGSATYSGTTAKNNTQTFTLNEGTSATITFTPDNGYRIKSVKVNSVDVTSSVSNNSYTVSNIKSNTTLEVEFEAIPIPTYMLYVKAIGNGSATYNGITAKNNTQTFTLNEGTSATVTFTPDNGYRIKSVKLNSADDTSSISNNQYTVSNIKANTTVEVEFEAIPIPTYTLFIKATGNGSATYSGTTAKNNTQSFTLNEGTNAAITFTPDNGYRIKSVKVNSVDVTSGVSNNSYTVSNIKANTTVEVEFEVIPINSYTLKYVVDGVTYQTYQIQEGATITPEAYPTKEGYTFSGWSEIPKTMPAKDVTVVGTFTKNEPVINTYTLTLTASGNGSATFNNTTAKNDSKTFTLNEGTSATITFAPDNGYRIKSVKLNSADVTSSVSNNSYTVSNIKANTTVEVEFEAIPINSYTLKYVVDGVTYQTYQIQEGATITPEAYPTKEGYTFSGWSEIPKTMPAKDVTVVGTFTKDEPIIVTYTLTLTALGNGSATFNNTTAKNDSKTFTLNEGTSATIAFTPDNGYRIKSVKVNSVDVTSSVSNNSYNVSDIKANTTVEVEFEAIPVNTYVITYVVDGETYKTYEIEEGAVITPEAEPTKDGYTFSGWSEIPAKMPANDVTITGTFTKMDSRMTIDGINYETVPFSEHLVVVAEGDYGSVLEVPETITYGNETWTVMGLKDGALDQCENLAAVIWEPLALFNARVSNPNLLLYVKDKSYTSFGVNNVIVNGTAESIELTDALSGNDFYCPRTFKARKISYSHRYNMETGLGDSKGWETIVLPFDVQKYTSPKGEIVPFTKWSESDKTKPFWLFELTTSGYKDVEGIKANTPYIISMPNNPQYLADYVIIGLVTFSAENVEVKASDDMLSANYQDRTFVPNYTNKAGENYFALNVNSYYVTNPGTDIDGSKFIKGLRAVHPFEAYMTTTSNTRSIDVMDGMTTAIRNIMMTAESKDVIKVYDTKGVLVKTTKANDDLRKGLAAGVYIVNGKKMIIK